VYRLRTETQLRKHEERLRLVPDHAR
jgi:hypothetical protein